MKSSLQAFQEGTTGQSFWRGPIPKEMEPCERMHCKVLFADGAFTEQANDADRARLAHKLKPVPADPKPAKTVIQLPLRKPKRKPRESVLRNWAADVAARRNREVVSR